MFFFFNFDNNEVPSFDQMMLPTLAALKALDGAASTLELNEKVIELMGIPEAVCNILHKGSPKRTEVAYRLTWSRTYLKQYGVLKNPRRGHWAFADEFGGDIESLDPAQIIRAVREGNAQRAETLSGNESALAFERLVLSLLTQRAQRQHKPLELFASDALTNVVFDASLPQGIDDIDGELSVIIKYLRAADSSSLDALREVCVSLGRGLAGGKILLILSDELSGAETLALTDSVLRETRVQLVVWTLSDISGMYEPDAPYVKYVIDPKQALIADAIASAPITPAEQAKRNERHLNALLKAYRARSLTLFLGAGVSIPSGIPPWTGLIQQLLVHMINHYTRGRSLTKAKLRELCDIAYENQDDSPLTQMRYIRTAFRDEDYLRMVHKVLYAGRINAKSALLNAIRSVSAPKFLGCGVRSIVTYNFDDLLEQNIGGIFPVNVVRRKGDMPAGSKLNIYHVHGYLPQKGDPDAHSPELIFSEEDYHRVYQDTYNWSNLTQLYAFRESTCLFIGCSLTDPNLRRLLDAAAHAGGSPRHFAFLKRKAADAADASEMRRLYCSIDDNIRDSEFNQLGLDILWVDDYDEIPGMLDKLVSMAE